MTGSEQPVRRILIGIIVFSILVRMGMALFLGDQALPISGAYDQVSYDTLAQRLIDGKGFSFPVDWYPFTKADEPTAHWSFIYALYLAGVYSVFGHHPLAARLIQVLLSGLQIWLVYRLGRVLFNGRVGLGAAALTAIYAYLIFFNAALMTQTFYISTVLAVLNLTLTIIARPTSRNWILLGICIGLGALFRQTMLLFAALLFVWILWATQKDTSQNSRLKILSGMFLSAIIVVALILPWTVRNYLTYHDFLLLNSNGGYWMYASNHPGQGTNFNQDFAPPIPGDLQGPEPAIDRALYARGFGFILADPRRFLLLSASRIKDYFWILPSEQSSLTSNLARLFSFALYAPFMLYGLWLSRHQWRTCMPLYLYVLFDSLLSLATWSAPRYRLPSDAVMMVFAGLAVLNLAEKFHLLPRVSSAASRI